MNARSRRERAMLRNRRRVDSTRMSGMSVSGYYVDELQYFTAVVLPARMEDVLELVNCALPEGLYFSWESYDETAPKQGN